MIQNFVHRAFRRPVQLSEIQPYLTIFEAKLAADSEWNESLIDTLPVKMASVESHHIVEEEAAGIDNLT